MTMPSEEIPAEEISGLSRAIRLVRDAVSGVGFGDDVPCRGAQNGGGGIA